MEQETFHTLNNPGDHCEPNFGHGSPHLSVVFAVLMLLAFVVDQVQQLCCPLCQAVWAKLGSKRRLGARRRALCYDDVLHAMRPLFEALFYGIKQTVPAFAGDASSSLLLERCDEPC